MRKPVVLIRAEAAAPAKPAFGAPCNGCGLCCLAEPCPAGVLASGRRDGACAALRWDDQESRYRCGLVSGAPAPLAWLARRWISAGSGCDADFVAEQGADPPAGSGTDPAVGGGADARAQRGAEAGASADCGS